MARLPVIVVACMAGLLTSCGQSAQNKPQFPGALGDDPTGAPVAAAPTDPGILHDATTYSPAKVPGALGVPEAGKAPVVSGDADAQVRTLVTSLVAAVRGGQADLAMKTLNATQAAAFDQTKYDALFATFDNVTTLSRALEEKLGGPKVEQLLNVLYGWGDTEPKWDLLDASNATVKPNLVRLLLGPAATGDSLALTKVADGWKVQLPAALTPENVEQILAYHQQLQQSLLKIVDWLDKASLDEAALRTALGQALAGQPVELPETGPASQPGETPTSQPGEEKPTTEPASGEPNSDEPPNP